MKFLVENKSKGPIRINVGGRDSLVLKPGKQELEEKVLNVYRAGISVWEVRGIVEVVPVEEKEDKKEKVSPKKKK